MMRETGIIALCALVIFCYCSVTKGDHGDSTALPPFSRFTPPATPSSPQSSSTTQQESLGNSTAIHLSVSSEADRSFAAVPKNGSLIQGSSDPTNSTITSTTDAPGAGTTGDSTSVPLNTTESQDRSDLSAGDNQTVSSPPATTLMVHTILPTWTARGQPQTSTSSPPAESPPPTTPTKPWGIAASSRSTETTSVKMTTAQTWHKALTVSAKHTTTASTTTTTTTIQSTEASKVHVSTPLQAKAHAETPSELNVGDDESRTSLDPLLAGLVSVFVVTTAIISLLIFLKFRHRNERPEFRRLQDLPMDDMMEDTPLSMYSY